VWFSLPIFCGTAGEELETSFRFVLRALMGLPPKCSNSALYVEQTPKRSSIFATLLDTEESAECLLNPTPPDLSLFLVMD